MERKRGVLEDGHNVRLKDESLMQAVRIKQARELKENRIIPLVEIVRESLKQMYKAEIENGGGDK